MTERNTDRKIQLHVKGISPISRFLITFRWFEISAWEPPWGNWAPGLRWRWVRRVSGSLAQSRGAGGAPLWAPAPSTCRGCTVQDCLPPRHPGCQKPHSRAETFPPVGFWRPWQLQKAGITHRNSLNTFSNCPVTRVGPGARQRASQWFLWCQIQEQAEGGGHPDITLSAPPKEQRGPTSDPEGGWAAESWPGCSF